MDESHFKKQKYLPYYETVTNIYTYLDNSYVVYKDYDQLIVSYKSIQEEILEYRNTKDSDFSGNYMFQLDKLNVDNVINYMSINNITNKNFLNYNIKTINNFNEDKNSINNFIRDAISNNKTVIICLTKYQIRSILKVLNMKIVETTFNNIVENEVNIVSTPINEGFIYNDYIFLSSRELFIIKSKSKKYNTKFKYAVSIKDINKLEIGDYVVHNVHGIGIYNGIKTLNMGDIVKDYIEVIYQGKDKLYIPVEKIDLLSKYSGKEGVSPKINKLGGSEWQKTKSRVKQKVIDMLKENLERVLLFLQIVICCWTFKSVFLMSLLLIKKELFLK